MRAHSELDKVRALPVCGSCLGRVPARGPARPTEEGTAGPGRARYLLAAPAHVRGESGSMNETGAERQTSAPGVLKPVSGCRVQA